MDSNQKKYFYVKIAKHHQSMTAQETEIYEGCLKQDKASQKLLYNMYTRKMMGVCLRYTRDEYEAENILQESFVKIFNSIKNFQPVGSLEGWIKRIIVNTATDYYRKMKRLKYAHESIDEEHNQIASIDIDNFGVQAILEVMQTLPEGSRLIFNMYAIEGYTHQDIADELGISVGTSKSQYSRAKAILKQKLEKLDKDFFLTKLKA